MATYEEFLNRMKGMAPSVAGKIASKLPLVGAAADVASVANAVSRPYETGQAIRGAAQDIKNFVGTGVNAIDQYGKRFAAGLRGQPAPGQTAGTNNANATAGVQQNPAMKNMTGPVSPVAKPSAMAGVQQNPQGIIVGGEQWKSGMKTGAIGQTNPADFSDRSSVGGVSTNMSGVIRSYSPEQVAAIAGPGAEPKAIPFATNAAGQLNQPQRFSEEYGKKMANDFRGSEAASTQAYQDRIARWKEAGIDRPRGGKDNMAREQMASQERRFETIARGETEKEDRKNKQEMAMQESVNKTALDKARMETEANKERAKGSPQANLAKMAEAFTSLSQQLGQTTDATEQQNIRAAMSALMVQIQNAESANSQEGVVTIKSKEEYDKLPSGTTYIDASGKRKTKV